MHLLRTLHSQWLKRVDKHWTNRGPGPCTTHRQSDKKKIRIGQDYCEIDVSCRERYTEELFSVLIFIDLKNVSNSDKREHNEEIFRFWDPAFWKSKKTQKWYFPRIFLNLKYSFQIFKINIKSKNKYLISYLFASDANNPSNWAATTFLQQRCSLFSQCQIYDVY